jgi:hypothetical protein
MRNAIPFAAKLPLAKIELEAWMKLPCRDVPNMLVDAADAPHAMAHRPHTFAR